MLNRRLPLHGLLAALLALMLQLGIGARVPRADPIAIASGAHAICHTENSGGPPSAPAPMHPLDCPVCPLCVALHTPAAMQASPQPGVPAPQIVVVLRGELPPPSTAPPATRHPPSQPRAPPTTS